MFVKFYTSITVTIIRRCAEHNNHNSWISIFLVIPLSTYKKQFCDKIMLVLDMKTVKDIFLKLHTNIKNH